MKDAICFVLAASWVASSIIGVLIIPDIAGIVAPIVYAVLLGLCAQYPNRRATRYPNSPTPETTPR